MLIENQLSRELADFLAHVQEIAAFARGEYSFEVPTQVIEKLSPERKLCDHVACFLSDAYSIDVCECVRELYAQLFLHPLDLLRLQQEQLSLAT